MPFDADAADADLIGGAAVPRQQPPPVPEGQTADLTLKELSRGKAARVLEVRDSNEGDPIAERLRELGFVAGEPVKVVAAGPLGGEPLLVQIGFTRFALRKAEAARVRVRVE